MIKVEEPSKQKLEKIKIEVFRACPFLMPQRDKDKGVMTSYKLFVPDPKENEEKDPFEDNDKENEIMTNECKVIYMDEQLPPVGETVILVVVEVDHGESTDSKLEIDYDYGGRNEDGTWWIANDWDEGQPWAIVGWMPEPKLPSEEEIRKHKIDWQNVENG